MNIKDQNKEQIVCLLYWKKQEKKSRLEFSRHRLWIKYNYQRWNASGNISQNRENTLADLRGWRYMHSHLISCIRVYVFVDVYCNQSWDNIGKKASTKEGRRSEDEEMGCCLLCFISSTWGRHLMDIVGTFELITIVKSVTIVGHRLSKCFAFWG